MTPQAQAQAMIILMIDLIDLTQSDFQEITSSLIPPDSHISPWAVARYLQYYTRGLLVP